MGTGNKEQNQDDDQLNKFDQNIEWDNGDITYGHSITNSEYKKKNLPDERHLAQNEHGSGDKVNEKLKDLNLSSDEDPGNRNIDDEKGLGGKDQ